MNKKEFVKYIAEKHSCTNTQAEKVINMFTSSVIDAIAEGKEISLVGFGRFIINKMRDRAGRNPNTGEVIQIPAHNQPRFKAGRKLKDACNK